jgi:hypothetical protein
MQFKVPQFIDVEDKLFGPFTFKEFIYLAGGAGMIFVLYKTLPFIIALFFIIPVGLLSFLLVFYKINEKPFVYYLQAAVAYLVSSKLYIWKQRLIKPSKEKEVDHGDIKMTSMIPMTSSNKIKDIAWSLDVQEKDTDSSRK